MMGLTKRQLDLARFLQAEADQGRCPTYQQMMDHLDLGSKSGVARLLDSLVERSIIRRMPNRSQAIELRVRIPTGDVTVKQRAAETIVDDIAKALGQAPGADRRRQLVTHVANLIP